LAGWVRPSNERERRVAGAPGRMIALPARKRYRF